MLAVAALALAIPRLPVDEPITIGQILCHPRRLIVGLSPQADQRLIEATGARVLKTIPQIGVWVVEAPRNRLLETKRRLQAVRGLSFVDFDRAAKPAYTPNDPQWPDMWHFRAIGVDQAWDLSLGGDNAIVAVIDTGVDVTHPDLAANVWVNSDEIAGNGIDDDGNGYVDDRHGYDFAYGDSVPDDVHGHGTACAGIVAAVMDNNLGVTGIAPRAKVMAIKTAIDSGYFYDSANIPGYIYAADNGARVFSMSFFSDRVSRAERLAMQYAVQRGVLPIAAAGNDYTVFPYYPASYDIVLSVAATNQGGGKTSWSNYGSLVDVAAPGTALRTTASGGGYWSSFGGTSGACPHVAGVAALLLGDQPTATAAQIRRAIEDSATPVNQAPFGEFASYGLVNAPAAVRALRGEAMPVRPPVIRYVTVSSHSNADVVDPAVDVVRLQRFQGRGLQPPSPAQVTVGGFGSEVLLQNRERLDADFMPPNFGPIQVQLNGTTVFEVQPPFESNPLQLFTEASCPGGSVRGGFFEALHVDGNVVRVSQGFGSKVDLQIPLRLVQASQGSLRWTRRYTGSGGGTERMWVYNWSSASYPYGSWILLRQSTAPTTFTTASAGLASIRQWADPEGVLYLRLETTGLPSGAELELDRLNMRIVR